MAASRRINIDLALVTVAIVLTIFGLAVVFSAGQTDVPTPARGAYKLQAIWTVIGIVGAFAVSRASVRLIEWMAMPAYALTIVLLVALLVAGNPRAPPFSNAERRSWGRQPFRPRNPGQ